MLSFSFEKFLFCRNPLDIAHNCTHFLENQLLIPFSLMDRIFKGNGLVQMNTEEMGQAAGVLLVGKPSPMHESKDRQKKEADPSDS